jgi:Leucine-rich repeat (LRR) protein
MTEQLEFLQKCSSLIKLDLSHNHITRLPDKADFSHLRRLEVLLLHHNKFALVDSLAPLSGCPQLTYLTLHHNPLEATPRHEHQLVNSLPALKLLNHRIIHL